MKIEMFSPEHCEAVKELVLGVLAEQGFEYDPARDFDLDDIQGYYRDSGGMFYLGIVDGQVIGTSAVRRINDEACEIKRLYVKQQFRGRGFGRELFLEALSFARRNYPRITLKTDRSLVKAINIYLKHGFSKMKEDGDTLYFFYDHS